MVDNNIRFSLLTCFMIAATVPLGGQAVDVARGLASPKARQATIRQIESSKLPNASVLLGWADQPPAGLDNKQLFLGLAELFGKLKTREAIPFLIRNISLSKVDRPNIWIKRPTVIADNFPAAAALIQMGQDASNAVIHSDWQHMTVENYTVAIFVVSMIRAPQPAVTDFLQAAIGEADVIRTQAQLGLKPADSGPK